MTYEAQVYNRDVAYDILHAVAMEFRTRPAAPVMFLSGRTTLVFEDSLRDKVERLALEIAPQFNPQQDIRRVIVH